MKQSHSSAPLPYLRLKQLVQKRTPDDRQYNIYLEFVDVPGDWNSMDRYNQTPRGAIAWPVTDGLTGCYDMRSRNIFWMAGVHFAQQCNKILHGLSNSGVC
jgi:hypothetical protein